jgi:hypothetical protein
MPSAETAPLRSARPLSASRLCASIVRTLLKLCSLGQDVHEPFKLYVPMNGGKPQMEKVESATPLTEKRSWRVVSISFVIWFFVPLGIDKLLDSMRTADYGRLNLP